VSRRLNTVVAARILPRSKTSKSRSSSRGRRAKASVSARRVNDKGVQPPDEGGRLRKGTKPLNGKDPWTWLRDATSPRAGARSKPSRGCDNLRTERSEDLESLAVVDAPGDVMTRDRNPGSGLRPRGLPRDAERE
jgi:hypothetical protein